MSRLLLVCWLAVCTAGCGFQLRGSADLPGLETVRIIGGGQVMRDELTVFLTDSGVAVVEGGAQPADAELSLTGERTERRVLSIDPNTGKPREYELAYSVDFLLVDGKGEVLVRQQSVRLVRDFVFDVDAVIGKSREEGVLRKEMRRDAVQQIIRRLRASLAS